MTTRDTNLNVNVTATDRASATVREVGAAVEQVEGTHDIALNATGDADDQLADIRSKLDMLSSADQQIVLKAQADQAVREIGRAESKLRDIHKLDGDQIRVVIEARDNASKKLEAVRDELRALDGDTATVGVNARGDDLAGGDGGGGDGGGLVAAGRGALAVAGATAVTDQLLKASELAIQVQTVAELTGATYEQAAKTVGLFGGAGVEVGDLLDLLLQVNGALKDNPELAEQLGVKVGEGVSLIEQFLQATEGIKSNYTDAGERAQVASKLFGEEGVRQVGFVQAAYGDLRKAIDDTPAISSEEDLDRFRELNRQSAEIKTNFQIAKQEAAAIVVPGLNETLRTNDVNRGLLASVLSAFSVVGRQLPGDPSVNDPALLDVIARNQAGYFGGSFGTIAPATGTQRHFPGPSVYVFNPPGTPTATNTQQQTYLARNGVRLS